MLLYHGTNAKHLDQIMREGLKPRGRRKGNWQHTVASCPRAVYLTDAYPLYFAAGVGNDPGLILEIDTDLLIPWLLNADEDVLAQAMKGKDGVPEDLYEATKHFRKQLPTKRWSYEASLQAMGTCTYIGTIPARAIRRVAVIDWSKQRALLWRALDPSISILNYRYCGGDYKRVTRWLFGDEVVDVPPMPEGREAQMEWHLKHGSMGFVTEGRAGITVKDYSSAIEKVVAGEGTWHAY